MPHASVQLPAASVQHRWQPGMEVLMRCPSTKAGHSPARFLGRISLSSLGLSPMEPRARAPEQEGGCPGRSAAGNSLPGLLVCERWEMESHPRQPGHSRQRPMYNSPRKKKTVARRESLPTSGDRRQGQSTSTGERPYKGPLNWFPDRCCRMEGLELAASPSFLQTTCGEGRAVSGGPIPSLPRGLCAQTAPSLFRITCVPRAMGPGGDTESA